MDWNLVLLKEFRDWFAGLTVEVKREIVGHMELLKERGPHLGRPYVDTLDDSDFPNMKELRVQVNGDPWRIFFAFDPKRSAIFLAGGNKAGDDRFYQTMIPIADLRFAQHLDSLEA